MPIKSVMIAFAILFLSTTAHAQEFTADGAAKIKAELQGWLDRKIDLMNLDTTATAEEDQAPTKMITTSGDLTVTPEDSYYAAKLPFITFNFKEGGRFELGQIAMNIIPAEDDLWRTTLALPKTMDFIGVDGDTTSTISLGQQRFSGVWHTAQEIFVRYEADYHDINIDGNDKYGMTTIDRIHMLQDFRPVEGAENLYSGPSNLEISDIDFATSGENKIKAHIESLTSDNEYSEYHLFDSRAYDEKLLQLSQNEEDDPAFVVWSSMIDFFDFIPKAFTGDLIAKDIHLSREGIEGDRKKITLDRFVFDSYGQDMKSDNAETGLLYAIENLQTEGFSELLASYLPTKAKVDVKITQLALDSVAKFIEESLQSYAQETPDMTEEEKRDQLETKLRAIPALLADNGITIDLNSSRVESAKVQTEISGGFSGNADAKYLLVGDLTLKINGMEQASLDIHRAIQGKMGNPALLQNMFLGMTVVQGLGQPAEDGEGLIYKFELLENGEILVNTLNFKDMLNTKLH